MWSNMTAVAYAPLPLTVAHHELEPATSFISRLAARNGVLSVQEFCRDIRFPYTALVAGDLAAIRLLAQLGGCDADVLAFASVRSLGGNAFRLRDEIASSQSLQRSRIRVCPICVRTDVGDTQETWRAWRRITWQFASVQSCAVHDCRLISLPPEKITLRGYDFAAQLRTHWPLIIQSPPTAQSHTSFETWLTRRIGGKRGRTWFDQLELNVASRACEVLGLRIVEGPGAKLSGHCSIKWAQYADVGYSVLRNGEKAFKDVLSKMLEDEHVDRRFFSTVYGVFTTWLNGRGLGDEVEPLKAIVRDEIFKNFVVRRGVLVLGRPSVGKSGNVRAISPEDIPKSLTGLMVQRGLAKQAASRDIIPKGFVTQAMLDALQRETLAPCANKDGQTTHHSTDNYARAESHWDDRAMTVEDVVKQLLVTRPTVHYLCRNSLLLPLRHKGGQRKGSVSICRQSVAEFEKTYVSLGCFASQHVCRQGALAIRLKNLDLPMLAMPPKYSRIFWQKDLATFEV